MESRQERSESARVVTKGGVLGRLSRTPNVFARPTDDCHKETQPNNKSVIGLVQAPFEICFTVSGFEHRVVSCFMLTKCVSSFSALSICLNMRAHAEILINVHRCLECVCECVCK